MHRIIFILISLFSDKYLNNIYKYKVQYKSNT